MLILLAIIRFVRVVRNGTLFAIDTSDMETLRDTKQELRTSALKFADNLEHVANEAFERIVYREGLFKLKGWKAKLNEVRGFVVLDVYLAEDSLWENYFILALSDLIYARDGEEYEIKYVWEPLDENKAPDGVLGAEQDELDIFVVRVFVVNQLVAAYGLTQLQ